MMIQYALHQSSYLDAAKYYHKVWETPTIKEDVNGRGKEVRVNEDELGYAFYTDLLTCPSGTGAYRLLCSACAT